MQLADKRSLSSLLCSTWFSDWVLVTIWDPWPVRRGFDCGTEASSETILSRIERGTVAAGVALDFKHTFFSAL